VVVVFFEVSKVVIKLHTNTEGSGVINISSFIIRFLEIQTKCS
jgi:hypothetical protein